MRVLCKSEILGEKLCLRTGVVGEACEVKVGQWATREHVTGKHLTDWLKVKSETWKRDISNLYDNPHDFQNVPVRPYWAPKKRLKRKVKIKAIMNPHHGRVD